MGEVSVGADGRLAGGLERNGRVRAGIVIRVPPVALLEGAQRGVGVVNELVKVLKLAMAWRSVNCKGCAGWDVEVWSDGLNRLDKGSGRAGQGCNANKTHLNRGGARC